ncbi:MAG: class I adenylate-forming enzyme family protein [Pseudomonadota bacterium]
MPIAIDQARLGGLSDVRSGEVLQPEALWSAVSLRALKLSALGLGPGARVLISHGASLDFVIDLLAVWHLGASAACLAPRMTEPERADVLARLRPGFHLDGAGLDVCPDPLPAGQGEALILFTSGTTGKPKGVVLSAVALEERLALNRAHIPVDARMRTLCPLPTHFGHGLIGNLLTPLLDGGDVHLWPSPTLAELPDLAKIIDERRITFLSSVPTFWAILRRLDAPRPRRELARVQVGSAPLDPGLRSWVANWSGTDRVIDMYGMTEAANWIAGDPDGNGFHAWGGEIAILQEGEAKQTGKGELVLRSSSLFDGYVGDPEATRAALHRGWLRTGDLGEIDDRGRIRLTGRLKTQITRAGIQISPERIEALILACPGVTGAICFGYPDPILGEAVALALTAEGGTADEASTDDLLGRAKVWARARLMAEYLPDRWLLLPELPLTDRGKPDRAAVRDVLKDRL